MPQNMYNLLIQDVLVNREKYANAYKSQPYTLLYHFLYAVYIALHSPLSFVGPKMALNFPFENS